MLLFLFGMGRSGTSWIGKIFDSHPLTLYKHEPDSALSGVPLVASVAHAAALRAPILDFLARLPRMSNAQVSARLPVFPKAYRSRATQSLHELSVLAAVAASRLHRAFPVLQCARLNRPGVQVIWKSVVSLGRLGVIVRAADDYRAIQIIRHPCGYVSSVLRGEAQHKFVASTSAAEDYGVMELLLESAPARSRQLTLQHLRGSHPAERLTWIWVLMNEKAMEDTRGDARCRVLRYEDICLDPAAKAKELFAFCGLDWCVQTERFIRSSTLSIEASPFDRLTQDERRYYGIFRDPIKAAWKWRSQLADELIGRVFGVVRESKLAGLYPEAETPPARPAKAP
jgi:hypothetical protein